MHIALIALLVVAAFATGLLAREVHARAFRGTALADAARVAQLVPDLLRIEDAESITSATDMRPIQTFWEVRDKAKKSFVYEIEDDEKLTYGAIRGMLASLDDPWTRFYSPAEYKEFQVETEGHFDGIGAVLQSRRIGETGPDEVVIISILPEGPAKKAKPVILPGDVIVAVDDGSIRGLSLQAVVNRIRGKRGTTVKLHLKREGHTDPTGDLKDRAARYLSSEKSFDDCPVCEQNLPEPIQQDLKRRSGGDAPEAGEAPPPGNGLIEVALVRAEIEVPVLESKMLDDKIGYVWLRTFNKQAELKLRTALKELKAEGMRGLLLDLSINGGGLLDMAVAVSSMFVNDTPVVYVQERGQEPEPLNARRSTLIPTALPMVVLVDRGSASASEIVAACLQDVGRAKVVGQNTFGKAKVQTVSELNDKSALILSTAVYLTPKKRDISLEYEEGKRGVKPDHFFPEPDLENIGDEPDWYEGWHEEQIGLAVEVLEREIAKTAD